MPFSENIQKLLAYSLGVSGLPFAEYAEYAAFQQELMSKAMFITGRTEKEIRAAVAQSPYTFESFVARLAAGIESIDPRDCE